jgi:hypothetical protein
MAKQHGIQAGVAALIHILRDKEGFRPSLDDVNYRMQNGIEDFKW